MIPQRKAVKKQRKVKQLGRVGEVKVWFDRTHSLICFRPKGRRRKVESISLIDLWDKVSGQL